ncbi:MAG: immunoglobulin domain-containing protein [Verrucomicrobiota bacterium]
MKKLILTLGFTGGFVVSLWATPGYFCCANGASQKIFNTNELASPTGTSSISSNVFPQLRIAVYYNTNGLATNLTDCRAYIWPSNTSSGITGLALYTNTSGILGFGSFLDGRFSAGNTSNTAYKAETTNTTQFQVRVWDNTYGATWEMFKTNMAAGNVPLGTLYGLSPVFYFAPSEFMRMPPNPPIPLNTMTYWNLSALSPPPPTILTQPQSTTVLLGSNATFTASATSTNPFVYAWYFNTVFVIPGATNDSLTLTNVRANQEGNYQVVVTDIWGSSTSSAAMLTVLVPAALVSSPTNQVAVPGGSATFMATITGSVPMTYQWYFNGVTMPDRTNAVLTLTNIQLTHTGGYHVVAGNVFGMVTSAVATLSMVYPPTIVAQPQSRTNAVGTTAGFRVEPAGNMPFHYQWRQNGANLALATNATLTLTSLQSGDAGDYTVVVSNPYGVITSAVARLTVIYPPVITVQPFSQATLVGGTAGFNVAANGTTPMFYQWLHDGTPLVAATNSQLTISNVQAGDGGNYLCLMSNVDGMAASAVATLTLLYPPAIAVQPQSRTNIQGAAANFNVIATGTVPLSYQWQFNDANLGGATNSTLTINNAQGLNVGNYVVVVSNAYGVVTSEVATLALLYLPVITSHPQSQPTLLGHTANFSVTAGSIAPLSYQWRFNGANLGWATNNTLTIQNVQEANAGIYQVAVSNMYGRVMSRVVALSVLYQPALTTQPQSQTNLAGASAVFGVTATGTAPLVCQWYKAVGNNPFTAIAGETNLTLRLANLRWTDAGDYQVVITNDYGGATSVVASLSVLSPPVIMSQPQSYTNVLGTAVVFDVTVAGTAPLSFQWLCDGIPLPAATNTQFAIPQAQATNAGNYTCILSNRYGMATSAVATLTVLCPPTITAQPQSRTNAWGAPSGFTVTATGAAPLVYQWFREDAILLVSTNSQFRVTHVLPGDAGDYYCVVSNVYGMATSVVATLTVLSPPILPVQPQSQMNAQGSIISFNVVATGTGSLFYQWRLNGTNLDLATRPTLTINNAQNLNAGSYSVVVSNAYGMVTSTVATLTVLCAPNITTQPQSVTTVLGTSAWFQVIATGAVPLRYQWLHNGLPIPAATNSLLNISLCQPSDEGGYQVVALNNFGSVTSLVATLTVVDNLGPLITVNANSGMIVTQRLYTLSGNVTDAGRGGHGVKNLWVNGLLLPNVNNTGSTFFHWGYVITYRMDWDMDAISYGNIILSWNQPITLQPGINIVNLMAEDLFGNRSTNLFYLNFMPMEAGIPTVTITPPASPTYSNLVTATGTASDAKGVAEVWCQLNSGPWQLASGTTAWRIQVAPALGTNLLAVYAVDTSGNYSKTNRVKFVKLATDTLKVVRVGNGTLSPDLNGKALTLGNAYTMKASPGTGFLFSNWVDNGSVLTNHANLIFTMRSNLTLTANFVTNAFPTRKGDYAGLFCPALDIFQADWTNSGAIKLTVTDKGAFTGQLTYQGKVCALAGTFDAGGMAAAPVALGNTLGLQVWLKLDLAGAGGITGMVRQGATWTSDLHADPAMKQAQKANYTVAVETVGNGTNSGNLTLAVQPTGMVILSGTLSDKTRLTGSLSLTRQQELVMCQTLYGGKGMWLGTVSLDGTNVTGQAHWQKLSPPQQGFSVNVRLVQP